MKFLQENGIIEKKPHPKNRKVYRYHLTKKGMDLAPVLAELLLWGSVHLKDNQEINSCAEKLKKQQANKEKEIVAVVDTYR